MSRGIAPDCRRLHVDLPAEMYDKLKALADEAPAVSVAEYARRLLAWRIGFDLPPARERRARGLRLTGEPKKRTGPKPKYLSGTISDSSVREIVNTDVIIDFATIGRTNDDL